MRGDSKKLRNARKEGRVMIKILFVCLGNICRSPMAEFVFRDMAEKSGLGDKLFIASAATSDEALGCRVHRGTRQKLSEIGITTEGKTARKMTKTDYAEYDYIIGMDTQNIYDILKITGGDYDKKVYKFLDFADGGDIADPWYTGNFDVTYDDIVKGSQGLIKEIKRSCLKSQPTF